MVLFVTQPNDATALAVADILRAGGTEVLLFETQKFPLESSLSLHFRGGAERLRLKTPSFETDFAAVKSVWYRVAVAPDVASHLSPVDADFARRESTQAVRSLWHLLRDRFWVNDWPSMVTADYKPYQLRVAREVGLEIPRTLISNDPSDVRSFSKSCGNGMIYKTLTTYQLMHFTPDRQHFIFTNIVTPEELDRRCEDIALAPGIFQEYLHKRMEYRVTVVGKQLFTAEIDSQGDESSRIDWRRAINSTAMPQRASHLPPEIESKVLAFMERLGLAFGCIDLLLTDDGRYVFLEVNPTGQWYWLQERTGMPIAENVASMLDQADPWYRRVAASADRAVASAVPQ
ncbi:MAG TPA: hypothetical protein VNJ09_09750 [Chthonomonadales bacterium]|nr:hypothetical protein [Chthonomonadales bacterium]